MSDSSVIESNGNTCGGEAEEISRTLNEIHEILLNKQFICEAVTKVKEVEEDTDLEQSDFVASVATLEDMIDIFDNVQFYKQSKALTEEIISELKMERAKAEISVKELSSSLQKVMAVVETLKGTYVMNGRCL